MTVPLFFSVPGRPSNVQAVPVSKQTIRVLWDPPLEPNGIIIAYLLYYSKAISDPLNINSDKVTIVRLNGNATSRYLPELKPVTEYYFWVKASTSIGFGNHSAVVRQTTQETSKLFFWLISGTSVVANQEGEPRGPVPPPPSNIFTPPFPSPYSSRAPCRRSLVICDCCGICLGPVVILKDKVVNTGTRDCK